MKVLVLGAGGREHALAWRLRGDPDVARVHCAPGSPGIEAVATCHPGTHPADPAAVRALAGELRPHLVVVGPEAPLAAGVVDALAETGIPVFGPTRAAAEIETSKSFGKEVMAEGRIPTAAYEAFDSWAEAERFIRRRGGPLAVKSDGLFAGKGVVLARTTGEALDAARGMLVEGQYGDAGSVVVVEEFLDGEEASVICLADGEAVLTLPPAQDHKAAHDGDRGPNTGGMGAYSPVPACPPELVAEVERTVLRPAVEVLAELGRPYRGALYAGLMLTSRGIKVLEYNARFGDPEAQVILPRLNGPFAQALLAAAEGDLRRVRGLLSTGGRAAACVVLASPGYPGRYPKGIALGGLEDAESVAETARGEQVVIFHAGTGRGAGGELVTAGGRVLGVTALGAGLREAVELAYRAVERISFPGAHYRRDIGARALAREAAR